MIFLLDFGAGLVLGRVNSIKFEFSGFASTCARWDPTFHASPMCFKWFFNKPPGFNPGLQVSTPGSRFQPWVLRWERRPPTIGLVQFLMIFQCRYSFWHGQKKKQHPIWWTVFSTFCQLADIKGFCWGWFFLIVKALPFGALEKQPADTGGKKHKMLSFLHPTAVAMPIHSKHLPPWLGWENVEVYSHQPRETFSSYYAVWAA